MPIYEYECGACGEEHEILQKISERPLRKCPSCGALKLRRKISRSAFHLKGGGWYASDYSSSNGGKEKGKGEEAGASPKAEGAPEKASDSGGKADSGNKAEKKEGKSSD